MQASSAIVEKEECQVLPDYWEKACKHISSRDRVMRRLIGQYPKASLESRGNAFVTLARSIVGQQITVNSAQAIWDRFLKTVAQGRVQPTPQEVLAAPDAQLKEAGLSKRKIEYLHDLARHFQEHRLDPEAWKDMDDESIILELMKVRGIGRWTAELFLIFYMMRPNVFPLDDVGLMRGISLNYFSGEPVSRAEARELSEAWAPYKTVAIWYLWRSLEPLPVSY